MWAPIREGEPQGAAPVKEWDAQLCTCTKPLYAMKLRGKNINGIKMIAVYEYVDMTDKPREPKSRQTARMIGDSPCTFTSEFRPNPMKPGKLS